MAYIRQERICFLTDEINRLHDKANNPNVWGRYWASIIDDIYAMGRERHLLAERPTKAMPKNHYFTVTKH